MESDERPAAASGNPTVQAAAQLAVLRADRAAVAERAMQPWWYDALLGLLVFGLVSSYSAHESWVTAVALALFLAGCWALMVVYKRITGFWVNGMRPGRTQRATRVWLLGYVVVLALALAAGAEYGAGLRGAMVVGGAVLGIGVALISRWWSRIYIAELREEL
ncbi:hypothetical protein SAMN05661080_02537 [Modestobacter sp. DSM 44400]|uniref:hypothetical protein n=1 Tax=Modestobacter sp. DSM 44400 TaxID=1550230 RepID=UPI00089D0433|nr:hypothetical protein [Modestobacter sp. DSM 44400]SDY16410.1 hypothetical protein SAMN05661080_02537 [Modestobacter sp. DSM 44400]